MQIMIKKILIALLFGLSFKANALSLIDFPEKAEVRTVSDGMLVNGKKLRAWTFTSDWSTGQISDFYVSLWRDDSVKFDDQEIGGWRIINAMINGVHYTAKIPSFTSAESLSYVSTSEKPDSELKALDKKLTAFPKPSGTSVVTDVKSKDGVKLSNTLLMKNMLSITENIGFYNAYYKKYGWIIEKASFTKDGRRGVFMARNGPENINITIDNAKELSIITAVRVDVEL